ncbi:MAG TPA: M20 family metallopeptidase, partial [Candidatus Limnocylindria bacterium]|nr:M20 family metallopeptidase [Candidatus Limnocylindria bacterium]
MSDPKALRKRALDAIDDRRDSLIELSLAIHANPELGYQERDAALRLTQYLEGDGFKVTHRYKGVETAYRADAKGKTDGPRVAILAEYDALADLGHGCGHNLIAMIGTAAAVAVREVIEELPGSVAAIGTPAEEGGGGKVALLRAGGFDDVDAAMMIHPTTGRNLAGRHSLASNRVVVEYFGRAAHAASQPDQGVNALDAMIQLFNGVNAMRQQLRPDARVHGIIAKGGSAANVIPEHTLGRFSVRALDRRYQQEVLKRFIACAEGAATATGTTVKVTVDENAGYENMVFSTPMAERWAAHMRSLGAQVFDTRDDERVGSTDMGNVMQVLPGIHPYVSISNDAIPGHSTAFRDHARTPEALERALVSSKALALTALD